MLNLAVVIGEPLDHAAVDSRDLSVPVVELYHTSPAAVLDGSADKYLTLNPLIS